MLRMNSLRIEASSDSLSLEFTLEYRLANEHPIRSLSDLSSATVLTGYWDHSHQRISNARAVHLLRLNYSNQRNHTIISLGFSIAAALAATGAARIIALYACARSMALVIASAVPFLTRVPFYPFIAHLTRWGDDVGITGAEGVWAEGSSIV
jgi:hypothetical protein